MGARIVYDAAKHGSLRDAIAAAPAGATIVLGKGEFPGPLGFKRDLAIEGAGPTATYLAGGRAHALALLNEGPCRVRISGVTFKEGELSHGGAVQITAAGAALALEDCVFVGCRGRKGGGAIFVGEGEVSVRKALIHRCSGALGGAIQVSTNGVADLDDVVIEENQAVAGGGILARDNAVLRLRKVFVRRNAAQEGATALEARGTITHAPAIEIAGGGLTGPAGAPVVKLERAPGAPVGPTIRAKDATLPASLRGAEGFTDLGGNTLAG